LVTDLSHKKIIVRYNALSIINCGVPMHELNAMLNFNLPMPINNNEEYNDEDCIYSVDGAITTLNDNYEEILIGKVELIYCDLELGSNNECSPFDIMDCHSETTLDCYHILFDETTEKLKSNIDTKLDVEDIPISNPNILIIDRIEILPEYRGKSLTKSIIKQSLTIFSNKTFVTILKSFPLQLEFFNSSEDNNWAKKMSLTLFDIKEEIAKENLMNYYKSLGFLQIDNTEYMLYQ
jgi:hypothetical protein